MRRAVAALVIAAAGWGLLHSSLARAQHHPGGAEIFPALNLSAPLVSPTSTTFPLVVPAYSSRPGANATIYLDFDGDVTANWGTYHPGTTPAYTTDEDASTYTQQDLDNIHEIWSRVSEMFSPFNLNVTTVDPQVYNNHQAMRVVIGGDGKNGGANFWTGQAASGIALFDSFVDSDPNTVYVFPGVLANGTPKYTAIIAAHETAHAFGLQHQSVYGPFGNKTAEYNPGTSARAPIMGIAFSPTRAIWEYGTSSVGPDDLQDDAEIIASDTNAFGRRPDDHSNSIDLSTSLIQLGTNIFGSGVIETLLDQDFFLFSVSKPSDVTLQVTGAPFGAMLDPSMALYALNGDILDMVQSGNLSETILAMLGPGSYAMSIFSAGQPGDLGQYFITGSIIPIPEPLFASIAMAGLLLLRPKRAHAR